MAIQTVGIIGAGTMGNGIAQACAVSGLNVVMVDIDEAAVQRALQRINQMTADRLLKPSIAKSFAFEDSVAANQFMETCPAGGRVVMTLES